MQRVLISCFAISALIVISSYRDRVRAAARKWKELPRGAAMPLGEFQEDMCVGEGLPLSRAARRPRGVP